MLRPDSSGWVVARFDGAGREWWLVGLLVDEAVEGRVERRGDRRDLHRCLQDSVNFSITCADGLLAVVTWAQT